MSSDVDTPELTKDAAPAPGTLAAEEAARAARQISRRRSFHQMVVIVALAVIVRLPLIKFPMGQPAGIAAYVGQRWLDGAVPYRDVWDHHAPALYLTSGLAMRTVAPLGAALEQGLTRLLLGREGQGLRVTVGGAAPESCRLLMMAVGLATVLLIYRFVRRWCNRTEAVVAAGICGFFSGATLVQGDCLEPWEPATFFVVLAMLAALHSEGRRWGWLALSGLSCGVAMCFAPLAALYLLALLLWVAATNGGTSGRLRRWVLRPSVMCLSAAVPIAGFVAYFSWHGALDDLWRSAVVFNARYHWLPLTRRELTVNFRMAWRLAPEQGALWLFAGGWAIHAFSLGFRRETGLVALWGAVAVAAALMARRTDTSDFLQAVPPLAIGAALAVTNPSEPFLRRDARGRIETRSAMLIALVAALAVGFLYTERHAYLMRASRTDISTDRAAAKVADLIRDRTMPDHAIYVWGTRPQVYVLADRPAAHRLFYNRPLNNPLVVEEFFGEDVFVDIYNTLLRVQPAFVVTTEEYLPEDLDSLGPIKPWFQFMREHYDLWRIVEAREYSFTIFARKDRALLP